MGIVFDTHLQTVTEIPLKEFSESSYLSFEIHFNHMEVFFIQIMQILPFMIFC